MQSSVGAVATLINTVASWFMSEDGYAEWRKRKDLAMLRKAADTALAQGNLREHRRVMSELERLSDKA